MTFTHHHNAMPRFETTPRKKRRLSWWWAPVVILVAIFISFLFPWKLNFLRDTIVSKVQGGTGRSFAIDGDVWLYWLQGPRVTIDGVRLGNPAWASTPQMASVGHVDTTVSLLNLLDSRVVLPRLIVDKPLVNLEESADGKRNWYFDKQQSDSSTSVVIDEVVLNEGHVGYVVKHQNTDVQIDLATLSAENVDTKSSGSGGGTTNGIGAKATGKWNGLKLVIDAQGGDVLKLRDTSTAFPFKAKAAIGATHVSADGTVTGLAALKAADLKVAVSGQNLAEWLRIVGVALPDTPPYQTAGHLRIADGVYRYDDFTGRVGSSDIAGSGVFERKTKEGRKRSFVSGTVVSKQLDLTDFAPAIGKTRGGNKDAAQTVAAKSGKLLPQQSFNTEKWDTLDADVRFSGKSIKNAGAIPFDNLDMHIVMQDRVLSFTPLTFGFADGTMGGNFRFDGSNAPMLAKVDARFKDLRLSRLTPKLSDSSKASLGRLNGTVKLDGRGNSIAAMLGTSNGAVQIAMGRGELSSLLLELAGLQGPQIVRYLLGDKNTKVRCALGDFAMKNGMMTAKSALIDTDLALIRIDGSANFATEALDLQVTPLPKQKSIVVLRTPFDVSGSFASPSFKPQLGPLAARAGGAIALGLINPLAALLPLIETAPGKDADCAELLSTIKNAPVKNTDEPLPPKAARKGVKR